MRESSLSLVLDIKLRRTLFAYVRFPTGLCYLAMEVLIRPGI